MRSNFVRIVACRKEGGGEEVNIGRGKNRSTDPAILFATSNTPLYHRSAETEGGKRKKLGGEKKRVLLFTNPAVRFWFGLSRSAGRRGEREKRGEFFGEERGEHPPLFVPRKHDFHSLHPARRIEEGGKRSVGERGGKGGEGRAICQLSRWRFCCCGEGDEEGRREMQKRGKGGKRRRMSGLTPNIFLLAAAVTSCALEEKEGNNAGKGERKGVTGR